jgi:hypothetical protein
MCPATAAQRLWQARSDFFAGQYLTIGEPWMTIGHIACWMQSAIFAILAITITKKPNHLTYAVA